MSTMSVMAGTFGPGPAALGYGLWGRNLKRIVFSSPWRRYRARELVAATTLREEQGKLVPVKLAAAAAGGLLLGGAGAVVGALALGNRDRTLLKLEFSDGGWAVVQAKGPDAMALIAAAQRGPQ